jgi:hypothetical protein
MPLEVEVQVQLTVLVALVLVETVAEVHRVVLVQTVLVAVEELVLQTMREELVLLLFVTKQTVLTECLPHQLEEQ